jgi:CheY-like chemotaxis protein
VAPGQYVLISVTDTGTGISPENLTKVFEPFFTTKSASMRTGLGLAMIYGFVKQSKGHVRIYSEVGHGTTAKIYLPRMTGAPRIESAPAASSTESARVPAADSGEVVLMVEDDEDVLNSTVVLLRELGAEAIAQLKGGKRVDILFTDVVLPQGMNGRMVAVEALALRPAVPVLFTTGYARNAIVHNGQLDPDVQFLAKPYTLEELAQKLRAALDGVAQAL